jgi:hypothetical protein
MIAGALLIFADLRPVSAQKSRAMITRIGVLAVRALSLPPPRAWPLTAV